MSHPENLQQALAKLEPDASYDGCAYDHASFTPERRAALSSAISLKRIADFICGTPQNLDVVEYVVSEMRSDR